MGMFDWFKGKKDIEIGKYAGEWKDGKQHGQGAYTFSVDGTVKKGLWENGDFIGE